MHRLKAKQNLMEEIMYRHSTIAALITAVALSAPGLASADPACDAMFAQVRQDIKTSNIPRNDEPGDYSDQTSLLKIARTALSQCRWGNDDKANKSIAAIYGFIPHKGAALTIARAR